MQNYSKSIANALELLQPCTKPSVRSYGLTLVVLNLSGKNTKKVFALFLDMKRAEDVENNSHWKQKYPDCTYYCWFPLGFIVISHTPVRSRFYYTRSVYNGIQLALLWWICYTFSFILFKYAILVIALMNFGETRHSKGRYMAIVWGTVLLLCCDDCDNTQQYHDVTRFECVLWRHTMHEWLMNIDYQI